MLLRVAASCSELQCVTVCCCVLPSRVKACLSSREKQRSIDLALRMLQCVAASCRVLQCVAVYCSVLQCVASPLGKHVYRASGISNAQSMKRSVFQQQGNSSVLAFSSALCFCIVALRPPPPWSLCLVPRGVHRKCAIVCVCACVSKCCLHQPCVYPSALPSPPTPPSLFYCVPLEVIYILNQKAVLWRRTYVQK